MKEFETVEKWDRIIDGLKNVGFDISFNKLENKFKVYDKNSQKEFSTIAELDALLIGMTISEGLYEVKINEKNHELSRYNSKYEDIKTKMHKAADDLDKLNFTVKKITKNEIMTKIMSISNTIGGE